MKLAWTLIVKGEDSEAKYLKTCLKYIAPHVDGLFITVTHRKGEKPSQKVMKLCEQHSANVSTFEWVNDFAAARNYNWSQVPEDYTHIGWCDADDAVRGAENIKDMVKENPRVDAFSMWYLYAFDEDKNPTVVHHKIRIVKNDGSFYWKDKIHEYIHSDREVDVKHCGDDVDVLHLSDEEHFEAAKERNLEIANEQVEADESDPRGYWNKGKSLMALGKSEEAVEAFETFISLSKSDEEKYLAYLGMADSCFGRDNEKAYECARNALGLKPSYPDAYMKLGQFKYYDQQYEEAKEFLIQGLQQKPPYYSIVVYNPREYDLKPLQLLGYIYVQLSQPSLALEAFKACQKIQPNNKKLQNLIDQLEKESEFINQVYAFAEKVKDKDNETFQKELAKLPESLHSHPMIVSLKKRRYEKAVSSGKDIVFYCGYTSREWSPEVARTKGVGGSEEAIIHLSRRLAERGWNVTVYNNCGHKAFEEDGVQWKPFWEFNPLDKQDIVVVWRHPRVIDYDINADKVMVDVHDMLPEAEFTKDRLEKIDKIFIKSDFHRSIYPNIPDEKFAIIPNGIESEVFAEDKERDQYLMVNTSSPDRSLDALIPIFKEVKKQVPEARLKWAYGWGVFDTVATPEMREWKEKIQKEIEQTDGIEELGMISHSEVADLYKTAGVFAYPSEFAEIDCISLSKAMAGGAIPVTTDFAAMGGKQGFGEFIHSDKTLDNWNETWTYGIKDEEKQNAWVNACVRQLTEPGDRKAMRKWAQQTFEWSNIVDQWEQNL